MLCLSVAQQRQHPQAGQLMMSPDPKSVPECRDQLIQGRVPAGSRSQRRKIFDRIPGAKERQVSQVRSGIGRCRLFPFDETLVICDALGVAFSETCFPSQTDISIIPSSVREGALFISPSIQVKKQPLLFLPTGVCCRMHRC